MESFIDRGIVTLRSVLLSSVEYFLLKLRQARVGLTRRNGLQERRPFGGLSSAGCCIVLILLIVNLRAFFLLDDFFLDRFHSISLHFSMTSTQVLSDSLLLLLLIDLLFLLGIFLRLHFYLL